MKKLLMLLLVFIGLTGNIVAEEVVAEESEYTPVVSGDVTVVVKKQDEYTTPFDIAEWGWNQRAGASERDDSYVRVKGNLNVSSGNPGVTEWFSVLSLSVDANAQDNVEEQAYWDTDADGNESLKYYYDNIEEIDVSITNAFVMWRPLEIAGGRPLGISLGNQSIKASANTAYSHVWGGDLDNDYVLHSMSALLDKPMLNIDFHIAPNTGIGYALAKGSSDLVQNSAAFDDDYSLTNAVYAEAELAGFTFNAAYQYVIGNRDLDEDITSDESTSYLDQFSDFDLGDLDYSTSSFNAQLGYNLNIANFDVMPYVGYQMLRGDEASVVAIQGYDYDVKEANLDIITAGAVISTEFAGKKVSLAGGYNIITTEDYDGLDGLEDGYLDYLAGLIGTEYANLFDDICGDSSAVYTVLGLDAMYNLEASVELTERASVSIFLNGTISQDVENLEISDEDYAYIAAITGSTDSADDIVDGLDAANAYGTVWTDNMSFGVQVNYKF